MSSTEKQIFEDELLDIVDEHDQVIATMMRSEVYEQKLQKQIRSVWLMIKNSQGQLWILRRTYNRPNLPGCLDGAVVGHVKSGESYEEALRREGLEEINIDVQKLSYRLLGKLTPARDHVFCFAQIYEATLDNAPQDWNRDEFCESLWITPQELMRKIEMGEKHKSVLPVILKAFYNC